MSSRNPVAGAGSGGPDGGRDTVPLRPGRSCDIVMKGGVTSGIVYPHAVVELAKGYRFASIGGTSAGAIAASLTAAAEFRRRNGSTDGFTRCMADLPADLAAPAGAGTSKLFSLFRPDRSTRSIFNAVIGAIEEPSVAGKVMAALKGVFAIAPFHTLVAFCLWSILALLVSSFARETDRGGGALMAALMGLSFVGVFFGWLSLVGLEVFRRIGENAFGLCKGFDPVRTGGEKPLTEWLADLIDETAGKEAGGDPLTFGDLEGEGPREGDPGRRGGRPDHDGWEPIVLRVMTTNLTHGRPYQLPFDSGAFHFDPAELREFFPGRIVDWMVAHSIPYGISGYRSLPKAADLPVVFAARLSLSFPLLMSAVPLYAVDRTREANRIRASLGRLPELERCWFSDGGICSNFPVHLFDGPIPSRPTFAINLGPFHPDHPRDLADESRNVWMPRTNGEGDSERWARFGAGGDPGSVLHFLMAIVDTMQNWVDNTQLRVPGYRDRVAHVSMEEEEGGLNLDMDPGLSARLARRGMHAGRLLRTRFTGNDPASRLDWDNHRWVRYRSAMTLLEDYLGELKAAYDSPPADGERPYADLVRRPEGVAPPSYPWPGGSRDAMIGRDTMLQEFIGRWAAGSPARFGDGAPRPVPELRIRPRL